MGGEWEVVFSAEKAAGLFPWWYVGAQYTYHKDVKPVCSLCVFCLCEDIRLEAQF